MVCVWVAGKTGVKLCDPLVTHGPYLSASTAVLPHNKALYKSQDYLLQGQSCNLRITDDGDENL